MKAHYFYVVPVKLKLYISCPLHTGGYLIFAFLPFMLHSFFPDLKAEQVGEMNSHNSLFSKVNTSKKLHVCSGVTIGYWRIQKFQNNRVLLNSFVPCMSYP